METYTVGVHEAKTHFSDLLRRVERGQRVAITRRGRVVAELSAHQSPSKLDIFSAPLRGTISQSSDEIRRALLEPDPEFEALFYGGSIYPDE